MSDDSDAEKTEDASPRKIEKAREEGDVPRSRELATFTVLMTAGACLWAFGGMLVGRLATSLKSGLTLDREQIFNPNILLERILNDIVSVMLACLPIAGAVMLIALISPMLIGGWLFSAKAFMPNFGKLNPIKGIGNMFSKNALVELLKAIIKTIVIGVVAWIVVSGQKEAMLGLAVEPLNESSAHVGDMIGRSFLFITGALGVIALIDGPYQLWHWKDKLKMTRQEMIQESKESDGNPQIKGKIRQMQREMARGRMMQNVPTADVIVTNPTHYAVALKYADGKGAPRVVAKGVDDVAAKIREMGAENKVPMLEAPALARALFKHTEIDEEIPEKLYSAVAEVLAYVYQLRAYKKGEGDYPDRPTRLKVPAEMDPLNPASQQRPAPDNGATE
ncbi:flagellar biosynthesis protein FlhB [Massilia aurea]|jgi:flagellar biosynthetic protein FlhB|uniref:Flagellar biosynthetic protein FlhB n=1 Tax=Massilia aurea TaxID=373040 RepID=A0A7X0CFD3_9BURK|nr:flagellar biosynthesis protein FlhB [Massilia aurea]MBB6135130.1 flagellar biosynthetic protein FlhB [Massilia aurea]MCS0706882.1 flagellar biosynthesis protein FlhB [Massilia aurea]